MMNQQLIQGYNRAQQPQRQPLLNISGTLLASLTLLSSSLIPVAAQDMAQNPAQATIASQSPSNDSPPQPSVPPVAPIRSVPTAPPVISTITTPPTVPVTTSSSSTPPTVTQPATAPTASTVEPVNRSGFTSIPSSPTETTLSAPTISVPDVSARKSPTRFADVAVPNTATTEPSITDALTLAERQTLMQARLNHLGPKTVILTERTTGCQTIFHQQAMNGQCASAPHPSQASVHPPALSPRSRLGQRSHRSRANGYQVTNHQSAYPRATRLRARPGNGDTALIFPLALPATITSAFGWRTHPISGQRRFHAGTDIGAPMGTSVLAAYSGEVATATFLKGYGNTVILRHETGTQESRYAHLAEILVNVGDWVQQGEVIGLVGSTGHSTGPHLHFEWRHLTEQGWQATDAGLHLETALDNLLRSLQFTEADSPETAS